MEGLGKRVRFVEETRAFDFTSGVRFLFGDIHAAICVCIYLKHRKRELRSRKGMLVTVSLNHTLPIATKHLQNFEFMVPSIDLAYNC